MKIIIESFDDLKKLLEMFRQEKMTVDTSKQQEILTNNIKQQEILTNIIKQPAAKESPAPEKKKRNRGIDYGKIKALKDAGWTAEKIADEMGISVATVYNHSKGV